MTVAPLALLAKLGLFIDETFLPHDLAARCVERWSTQPAFPGEIAGGDQTIDRTRRRVSEVDLPAPDAEWLNALIGNRRDAIERHLAMPLGAAEPAAALHYTVGDFFRPHRDRASTVDSSSGHHHRRVSVVVFLNDAAAPITFAGGHLRLYGVLDPAREDLGVDVEARAGTLVAFRSDLLHEVTPITAGDRFTVVTWFRERQTPGHVGR